MANCVGHASQVPGADQREIAGDVAEGPAQLVNNETEIVVLGLQKEFNLLRRRLRPHLLPILLVLGPATPALAMLRSEWRSHRPKGELRAPVCCRLLRDR